MHPEDTVLQGTCLLTPTKEGPMLVPLYARHVLANAAMSGLLWEIGQDRSPQYEGGH